VAAQRAAVRVPYWFFGRLDTCIHQIAVHEAGDGSGRHAEWRGLRVKAMEAYAKASVPDGGPHRRVRTPHYPRRAFAPCRRFRYNEDQRADTGGLARKAKL